MQVMYNCTWMVLTVEGLYSKSQSNVWRLPNYWPPTPPPPSECVPPAFGEGGGHTRWVERGLGVQSSEDARHCSVLYICKYFVVLTIFGPAVCTLLAEHGPFQSQLGMTGLQVIQARKRHEIAWNFFQSAPIPPPFHHIGSISLYLL